MYTMYANASTYTFSYTHVANHLVPCGVRVRCETFILQEI